MSRSESDREDLIREATALTRRIELQLDGRAEPVVAGIREQTGWLSLYLGADPVYTWDADGGLRRAFVAGYLYRAEGETLARLERRRTETETQLVRHDLTSSEAEDFLKEMKETVAMLAEALQNGTARVLRSAGNVEGFLLEVLDFLPRILSQDRPWAAPVARRK